MTTVAEWKQWLESRGFYTRAGEAHDEENHTTTNNASSPPSSITITLSDRYTPWGFVSLQRMLMALKGKSVSSLHTGIAGVVSLLLLILVYQISVFLSDPNAEVRQALQDVVYVSSPTFNCSKLQLKGDKLVLQEQHYHTFPSNADPRETCQSKFQHHCFRVNTGRAHFPSQKFLSRLRAYEAYHEKCTKGHNLTPLGVKGDTPEGCKYLVWKAMDGMGNQLLSLVCAFVYSLLTNRAMLIATDSHIDNYLCNPFPSSSWVLPNDFPEAQLRGQAKRVHVYLAETLATVQAKQSGNTISPADLPHFISQAPKHLYAYIICCDARRDHQFFCPTAQKLFAGSNWLFYHSHEYTLPGFYFIPEFRQTLNEWFPHHDVFMHASRYLLNPANRIWERISQFYKAHMDGVDKRIGIQPRSWSGNYDPSISRQILRCALEQHLLPKALEADQKTDNKTTPPMGPTQNQMHPNVSVLVSSLRGEYRDNLALEYANHSEVQVLSASREGVQKTGNAAHDETAVIDIWLLSFVHDLVITPRSTFGSTASGLAGIVPLLFNHYGEDKVLEPACARTNAGGPCFLVFPINQPCDLDAAQSSISEPDKKVPEVKYCQFNQGLGIETRYVQNTTGV